MKTFNISLVVLLIALLLFSSLPAQTRAALPAAEGAAPLAPLGTAFTYQGRLIDDGTPADGEYDFQFKLYDALSGGVQVGATLTQGDVAVSGGLFTVELDFGSNAFDGDARWLQISVRPGSSDGAYTSLSPRQSLTAAPYALYSLETGPHDHWGETWSGTGPGLTLNSDDSDGVYVDSAGDDGLHVDSANDDGVRVDSAGNDGVYVNSAGDDGLHVDSAGGDGVYVYSAGDDGLHVDSASDDGVYVDSAGGGGLHVNSAGDDGLHVGSANDDGVYVYLAGGDGVYVGSASGDGAYVGSAGGDGVYVNSAGDDGLQVYSANDKGIAASGDSIGVLGDTTRGDHEWGFYTNDKMYAGSALLSAGPQMLVAQNGGRDGLEPGDVIAVAGLGAPFGESDTPTPLVQRADGHAPVFGVVYGRFTLTEETETVEIDGREEERTELQARSAAGRAAPGEYLLVVIMGAAQVKANALSGDVYPGALLSVGADGRTAMADAATPFGAVVGAALEAPAADSDYVWVLVNPR